MQDNATLLRKRVQWREGEARGEGGDSVQFSSESSCMAASRPPGSGGGEGA